MTLADFAKHKLIGTFLGELLANQRQRREARELAAHQLEELANESRGFDVAMRRILNPTTNCVDVGAHLGFVMHRMQTLAQRGSHIAIEPVPYKARWLAAKFPQVTVHQVAVSDHDGEADFFVHRKQSGYSGLRRHDQTSRPAPVSRIRVRVTTLDQLLPQDRSIGFIKLDVEGGELAALRGARATIARCQPYIEFECTATALAAHEVDAGDVFAFLDRAGYGVFTVKCWLGDEDPLSCDDFLTAMKFPFRAFNFLAVPASCHARTPAWRKTVSEPSRVTR